MYRSVPYEFASTLPHYDVVVRCLPRPWKICDTPPLGVLKKVFTSTRSW